MDENNTMNNNPEIGEKTFTQEDVNRIIGERLAKEKAKGEAALAEREQQYAERERQLANREALCELRELLKEKGLPDELIPVLNVQDKAALKTALDALEDYIKRKSEDEGPYKVLVNKLPRGEHVEYNPDRDIRKAMGLR